MHSKSENKNKWLIPVLIILVGGIVFSAYKLIGMLLEYHKAAAEFSALSDEFIVSADTPKDTFDEQVSEPFYPETEAEELAVPEEEAVFQQVSLTCPFGVAFERMWETNRDVVAWLSSPDTVIDYPVMHGATNDTYLHANWKGSYSVSGSIFTNWRCSGYLDDFNTIIYGHNMKDGSMFHSIKSYSSQSYYEKHPYIWYVTPEAKYVLYVVAGFVASTGYDGYYTVDSVEEVQELLHDALDYSDFEADYVIDSLTADEIVENAQRMVLLSTCSYEFDNARYVIVAVPLLAG